MKGRPPRPPHLRLVTGNVGHRKKDSRTTPKVASELPDPPRWLSKEARAQWDTLAPTLHSAGLLTRLDAVLFGSYCATMARWIEAEQHLNTEGTTYVTPSGFTRPSVWFKISSNLSQQLLKLGEHYGLTPASRQRLKVELPSRAGDTFLAYLKRGEERTDTTFKAYLERGKDKSPAGAPRIRRQKPAKAEETPPEDPQTPPDLPPAAYYIK